MSRLRPVLLTTVTTIFGLLFLSAGYSIDVLNREIFEGTSTVKWYQVFGISICWGLGFSTLITLLVTPSFLVVLERLNNNNGKPKSGLFQSISAQFNNLYNRIAG